MRGGSIDGRVNTCLRGRRTWRFQTLRRWLISTEHPEEDQMGRVEEIMRREKGINMVEVGAVQWPD